MDLGQMLGKEQVEKMKAAGQAADVVAAQPKPKPRVWTIKATDLPMHEDGQGRGRGWRKAQGMLR